MPMDPVYLESADGFRTCPYNHQHTIASVRFIGHLMKCSKSSGKVHRVCPWNAQHHIVAPSSYDAHMKTCIFRTNVETDLTKPDDSDAVASFNEESIAVYDDDASAIEEHVLRGNSTSERVTIPTMTAENHSSGTTVSIDQQSSAPKTGIYGSLDQVGRDISAIVDAFAASSFSKSANGLAILQTLVDTIYEEAEKFPE